VISDLLCILISASLICELGYPDFLLPSCSASRPSWPRQLRSRTFWPARTLCPLGPDMSQSVLGGLGLGLPRFSYWGSDANADIHRFRVDWM